MPKVFIIVLNWNGKDDTIECIESLKKIDYSNYKIVIVDNGSSDGSDDIIPRRYFKEIPFIETKKNFGYSGGNNIGIKYALEHGADYVLLLNNDTIVEPDFLSKLVEAAEANKTIGIVGPMIYFYDRRDTLWFGGGKVNWARTKGEHIDYGLRTTDYGKNENIGSSGSPSAVVGRQVDYITGCCLLIKRETIEKIGLLDEDYFLYYEDVGWCLRARKNGYNSVLVPSAKIYHKQSRSADEASYPYIYYHSRNGLILASRFRSKILALIIGFWIFSKQIVKLVIGYKKEWARPVIKGIKDFWRGRKGKLEGYY